ncbi:Abi-alpha family protein [Nocardioides jiangxiensis]|uniref:Abi-alpha family protein n=1 Tax=Nocardioides jiangxiensis TaxID=3064524 RepID=A0ABT9B127_9ACTN|nr:Abi-alpha family protein [Nocardioides sp. WY-20]MDO7867943.1 Abi-alpha family protein [Nocardioides sp. WY-20]
MSNNLPERAPSSELASPKMDALPGLVRLAATSWLRTAEWSVVAGVRTTRKVLSVATNPASALDLVAGVAQAGSIFGDVAKAVGSGVSLPQAVIQVSASLGSSNGSHAALAPSTSSAARRELEMQASLREQGQALLARSRDVWNNEQGHPAYARILSEMAPDEGRILLLLLRGGPQPAVDVRTGGAIGMVSSQLIAPGLNMIGPRAGVRYLDQVPSYLNNLFRLGLIWFSREQLRDPLEYQVVEAQPDVLAAMHSVRSHKVVRRSIHLTPFGEDFCRTCLLEPDEDTSKLPEHQAPQDLD